ncbi:MAG TPA: IS4 family transposase [Actinomycetota bacterium]|nr:IS4 family transposase [Actinomycetota bacterium]
MTDAPIVDAPTWAGQTFGRVVLGDKRRVPRAVDLGAAILSNPAASLPQQLATKAELVASYQLLHEPDVTHAALLTPHWQQTREEAGRHPLVLLSGDTTILDYSHHRKTDGLGPIGNGKGRGYLVHSVLALLPTPRQVLGLAHQIPLVPKPKVKGETLRQRQARRRQTDVWQESVEAIGPPPEGVCWVHVGDRGSDIFRFLTTCLAQRCAFLVRAAKNRRVEEDDEEQDDPTIAYLFPQVRAWPGKGQQTIRVPASHGKPAREATVQITWGSIRLLPPQQDKGYAPIDAWVVRVWEPAPPTGINEPIEWILLTSLETTSDAAAWERVAQYSCRWTNEDYHSCLKTGCAIEQRNLGDQPALERLLAVCAPVAIQLLQLRDLARIEPERPAIEVMDPDLVAVVAAVAKTASPSQPLTIQAFCVAVAKRGGYLGRKGDGPPGWKTFWRGWYDVQRILEGVRLARHLATPWNSALARFW